MKVITNVTSCRNGFQKNTGFKMIDPKTYWNCVKAKVIEPELCLRPMSVAVSKERLPGGCTLYCVEWPNGDLRRRRSPEAISS